MDSFVPASIRGYFLKLKKHNLGNNIISQEVKAAIEQIHNNNYPGRLKDFYGELILVGISYNKKTHECVIKRFEREN